MRADLPPPMHSPAPAVVWNLQAVGVQYGRVSALSGVTLRIAQGERVALVGSNGSGKSTLLRVLHGLVPASSGQVQQDGALRQAMLFQRPHMLRTSVQNNIVLGLWLRGTAWRDAKVQARTALQRVGLQAVAQQNARTLSGGQQQRLALARAWALRPDVLLLDEPTASLDPHAKRDVETLIAALGQTRTLVFASHNLGQVKRLATRVLYLEQGRVLADLSVQDFFSGDVLPRHHPEAHLFVQGEIA